MTSTINEIEAIEHLDFDVEVPCNTTREECPETAVWRVQYSCHKDHVALICEKHLELLYFTLDTSEFIWCSRGCNVVFESDRIVESIVRI